ncbi:secreted RxLR effector protein 161-like [Humulus lupulus]|uniref:secreted RxLR effector protein 161-like n=1 Tax=Humulus lupulus TaxID=3486 RepID=UPI002B410994|nr:secreted RxLR effector protein 161-like [Humulus lupulus]
MLKQPACRLSLSTEQCPVTDEERDYMSKVPYSTAVGSIMYSMVSTRPDLAYSICLLSKFMSNPGKAHWTAMKHVLRYMASTTELGFKYDADFAGDKDSRKSSTAYVFMVSRKAHWIAMKEFLSWDQRRVYTND